MHSNGSGGGDECVQDNAYFAIDQVGHTLEYMREYHSHEYLIECLEHATVSVPWMLVYSVLGPGNAQRFAAKGGYVICRQPDLGFAGVVRWIVPTATLPGDQTG